MNQFRKKNATTRRRAPLKASKAQRSLDGNYSLTIPKNFISQPFKSLDVKFTYKFNGALQSAMFYYNNKKVQLSLYQPYGTSAIIPGLSTYSTQYVAYLCLGGRLKCTFSNTQTPPVTVGMYPSATLIANDQSSLQPGWSLPECKTVVLGGYQSGSSTKVLSVPIDASNLLGYDVLGNVSGLQTLFGSNPSTAVGVNLIGLSVDQSSLIGVDFQAELEIVARMVTAKPILL